MANFYKNFDSATLMSFGKSFARLNGQPLDKSAIWYSKDEADTYAASASAYVGQPVAVINETDKITTLYVVGANGTLETVGSLPDGMSLEQLDGKIQIKGFADAEGGAQMRKNADGEIEWFVPSTDTVDGLQATVAGLQSDMKTAQEDIAAIDETIGLVPEDKTLVEMIADAQTAATYDDTELAGRVTTVEEKAESLQTQINTIMNNPDTEGVINSIEEFTTYITEHGEIAEGFRTDIDANKQAIEDHEAAMAPLIEKLEAIEAGAQVNKIETVSDEFELTERELAIKAIEMSKVTGLADALAGKAGAATTLAGYGITDAYTKAETEERIQDVLDGLSDTSETAASVAQALETYKTSNDQRVSELESGKVDAVDGKSLVDDTLIEKLASIEAGAQVNVLEGVQVNGTALVVEDKIVNITSGDIVKASDEVTVAEDGTLGIGEVNVTKLVQDEGTQLILNGGSAFD